MTLHRAQILLEANQHSQLLTRAVDSGRSMSDLVREAVDAYLEQATETEALRRSLASIDELSELRRTIQKQRGMLEMALLDQLREERDADMAP